VGHLRVLGVAIVAEEAGEAFPNGHCHATVRFLGGPLDHLVEESHTQEELGMFVAKVGGVI